MLIDFTAEELGCILAGLSAWINGPGGMGPYDMEEMNQCESAQSKIENALQALTQLQISEVVSVCNCEDYDRVEAGDCPAGRWWWVCKNCGKKV